MKRMKFQQMVEKSYEIIFSVYATLIRDEEPLDQFKSFNYLNKVTCALRIFEVTSLIETDRLYLLHWKFIELIFRKIQNMTLVSLKQKVRSINIKLLLTIYNSKLILA